MAQLAYYLSSTAYSVYFPSKLAAAASSQSSLEDDEFFVSHHLAPPRAITAMFDGGDRVLCTLHCSGTDADDDSCAAGDAWTRG